MAKVLEVGYLSRDNEWRYVHVTLTWDGKVYLGECKPVTEDSTFIGKVLRTDPSDKRSWRGSRPDGRYTSCDSRRAALRYVVEAFCR